MKKLILLVGVLCLCHAYAGEVSEPSESPLKIRIRSILTRYIGEGVSNKLLGPAPASPGLMMPEIPKNYKKSTDVSSLKKISKESTEYDSLPIEKKRAFNYRFLQELFLVTRKTEAKEEDLSNWMNVLDQGGSREGIYQGLVLDEVYAALENLDEKPSPALISFLLKYAEKFYQQSYKEDNLKHLNLYSLKRIMTERGLDLMEYWENKDLDALYKWYALLSADLAKEQGSWLKSEYRHNPSELYHFEWAKGVPSQHVKSEFIIKLHTVMNGLQLLK